MPFFKQNKRKHCFQIRKEKTNFKEKKPDVYVSSSGFLIVSENDYNISFFVELPHHFENGL